MVTQTRGQPAQGQRGHPVHTGRQQLQGVGMKNIVGAQRAPQLLYMVDSLVRLVSTASQSGSIDGACRRATNNIEGIAKLRVAIRVQQLQQTGQHPGLIRAARPAPIQDQCHGSGRALDHDSYQPSVATLASTTVTAVILTIRRTEEVDVMMCTGARAPNRKGPIATLPPAAVLSRM